ncbi:MAG: response regulator, partial [Desulfobacterales bacterium]
MHFDAKEQGMSNNTKILLVEEDADICLATTQFLKSVGYHVREVSSAKECMAELRANLPDLLLMDVVLPDGDGCQLCSQIKADPRLQGIFVVLLSGIETSSNDQTMGLNLGADGFIARPVSNEELLARIQAMDRTRLAEKALQEAHDALEIRVRERTAELAKVNEQLQIEINERQRKESILRETLQRLNEAERVGNFGYRVHDVRTGEEWWSENEYAIYGLPKNVKPSYDLHLDCVHPDDRAIHDRKFKDGWESDSDWHSFEYRIVRRDAEVRNILARYRFERDTQGNPLRALGTDQDITDQKISEKIL